MTKFNVLKPGTLVTVKTGKIEAMVTAIIIRFDTIFYEVKFYNGTEFISQYFKEEELSTDNSLHVGFNLSFKDEKKKDKHKRT